MNLKIFYSWQSDLPNKTNRGFIKDALERAIKKLNIPDHYIVEADRDTQGTSGSPNIVSTILNKIRECSIFVADVSIINSEMINLVSDDAVRASFRPCPNPNVLFELGYAVRGFDPDSGDGWGQVIMVFNRKYGNIEDLPFDIRQHRLTTYSVALEDPPGEERKNLASALKDAIESIIAKYGIIGFLNIRIKNNKAKFLVEKGFRLLESEEIEKAFIISNCIFKSIVWTINLTASRARISHSEDTAIKDNVHIFKTIRLIKEKYKIIKGMPREMEKQNKNNMELEVEKAISLFLGLKENDFFDFKHRIDTIVSFGSPDIFLSAGRIPLNLKNVEFHLNCSVKMFCELEKLIPDIFSSPYGSSLDEIFDLLKEQDNFKHEFSDFLSSSGAP